MSYDLAGAEYDVEHPPGVKPLRRSYLLCSNARSGSTLLSEALHGTGRLGTPIEYFDGTDAMAALVERWGCADLACYVACLQQRRTAPGGVLGAKLHWYQLREVALASGCTPVAGVHGRERALLDLVFPHLQFVSVVRLDRDRQAVSWAIAEATSQWTDLGDGSPRPEVEYDYAAIDDCRRRIDEGETGWAELFAAAGAVPMTVTYEGLAENYVEAVAAVAAFLGAELAPDELPAPRLRKQADERSERMVARYQQEREARGAAPGATPPLRGTGLFADAHPQTYPG